MDIDRAKKLIVVWGKVSEEGALWIAEQNQRVLVPEQRPYLLGLKYNAGVLESENIDWVYCTDNVLGLMFYEKRIDKVCLFCESIGGDKVEILSGGLYIALLAKIHNIPRHIFLQASFDLSSYDRDASTIERKDFILDDSLNKYIIEPETETIHEEVLS